MRECSVLQTWRAQDPATARRPWRSARGFHHVLRAPYPYPDLLPMEVPEASLVLGTAFPKTAQVIGLDERAVGNSDLAVLTILVVRDTAPRSSYLKAIWANDWHDVSH